MEKLKHNLIIKWIKEYISEIDEISFFVSEEERKDIIDIKEDLEICEKVINKYFSYINC